jgi:hypothetical protein
MITYLIEAISKLEMVRVPDYRKMFGCERLHLHNQLLYMYNIVQQKDATDANVLSEVSQHISPSRTLSENKWLAWLHLCQRLLMVLPPSRCIGPAHP